jgi:membrane-associated phospholipid phosphatase
MGFSVLNPARIPWGPVLSRRAPTPLAVAGACAVAAALVWIAAYHVAAFGTIDQRTLTGFVGLLRPETAGPAERMSRMVDPGPFALFAAALVVLALVRRRPRTAVAIAAILAGSNLTTQLLKPALALPPVLPGVETATWPSGHATAAMGLVLCLQLAVPQRLRPWAAALGGLFALGVASSVLILDHHEPSDVAGGFLVAGAWTALGVAALRALAARRPAVTDEEPVPGTPAALVPVAIAVGALALALGLLVVANWSEALDYASGHTTFVVGAALLAVAAIGMSAVASLGLTRSG